MLLIAVFYASYAHGQASSHLDLSAHKGLPLKANKGVVVEEVNKNSEAEASGLVRGDILVRWSGGLLKGNISSPLGLFALQIEQGYKGALSFEGYHGARKRRWVFSLDSGRLKTRPNFSARTLSAYQDGQDLEKRGEVLQAIALWREMGAEFSRQGDLLSASWLSYHAAESLARAGMLEQADVLYEEALKFAAGDPKIAFDILIWAAFDHYVVNDSAGAEKFDNRAVENARALRPRSRLLPLELASKGLSAAYRGDFQQCDRFFQEAVERVDQFPEPGLTKAWIVNMLASVDLIRGNFSNALRHEWMASAIRKRVTPNAREMPSHYYNLGHASWQQGNLTRAEEYYRQALAGFKRLDGAGMNYAAVLDNLGGVLRDKGDLAGAQASYRQALAIQQKLSPDRLESAESLRDLGFLAEMRADLNSAEQYESRALKIRNKYAPRSLAESESLNDLGRLYLLRKDLPQAKSFYESALAIREKLAPGSAVHAETLSAMAGIERQLQNRDEALRLHAQAMDAIEGQASRLDVTSDARAGVSSRQARFYSEYIDYLVELDQNAKAFEIAERSRAHALLETLALAQVDIRQGVDPALAEQERNLQAAIKIKSEHRIHLLGQSHTDGQIQAAENDVSRAISQYQDVESRIRAISPAYAGLTHPQPLTLKEIQQNLLDDQSLLLEYSLGETRSYVFAVTPDSFTTFVLPCRSEIERKARLLYGLIEKPSRESREETSNRVSSAATDRGYEKIAAELSRMLLSSVGPLLAEKRLLIVSEGALQFIPFAALPEPDGSDSGDPLVVRHEIVNLPSASAVAGLRKRDSGRTPASKLVAVFADPVFTPLDSRVIASKPRRQPGYTTREAQISSHDMLMRSAGETGIGRNGRSGFNRLIFTRKEAAAILAVIPQKDGIEELDFSANRATATSPDLAQYRAIHFATHGLVNSQHPELSGLVLSLVDKHGNPQDGFLQLQDIYNLKLQADLVVLSACETALGKEIQGEGLIGLTRGFMYAGASRVVASLWKVSDVATATLMADFYRAMEKEGMPASAALRAAQIKMWKQKRWSDPYFWAAFQIQGEWR